MAQKHVVHFEGRERSYFVHVPTNATTPLPAVLAFHGATSNALLMEKFCGLSEKSDQAGFVVVYPSGTGNVPSVLTWNGGACCGYAQKHNVNDIGFVDALLDELPTVAPVDRTRVFAAGMSNGAHMVYRLAAERADRFAAIAAVAGPMVIDDPRPSRPMPIVHIHGTHDEFARFEGGIGSKSLYRVPFRSVHETVEIWARLNGCNMQPLQEQLPAEVDDGTRLLRETYVGPAEVVLYVVEGGGHTWPGRPPLPTLLGKSTANLNANDVIWDFFARHMRS